MNAALVLVGFVIGAIALVISKIILEFAAGFCERWTELRRSNRR